MYRPHEAGDDIVVFSARRDIVAKQECGALDGGL
jgi:hypothetical protein